MRILITNDDGITAPGLATLEAIAKDLAGPDGEVWVAAPLFEQSGVGHCISYTRPMRIEKMAERRFAVEGSPADCVIAAVHDILADRLPDLILSGVNRGNNSAENVVYSGTIGAAMEGALQGFRAVALSQYLGPRNAGLDDPFEAALAHGAATIRRILTADRWDAGAYRAFYNINFPPVPAADVTGMKLAAQGSREGIPFTGEVAIAPNQRRYLWIGGGRQDRPSAPGTDAAINLDGYISVTPLHADLTARDLMQDLADAFD